MNQQRPGQQQAQAAPEKQEEYRELRALPIFEGIPNEDLWRFVVQGGIGSKHFERDVFVADPQAVAEDAGARIIVVASGQVAVSVFEPTKIAERKQAQDAYDGMTDKERNDVSALRPPPLARVARKNLATFMPGDIFNSQALSQGSAEVAFFSIEPSVVISISHASVAELATQYPFFEQRMRRAIEVGRERLQNVTGVKQEILDFFIRHGISVSGEMIRVRQLDTCIDCKLCEDACETRYGARRLTLGGYQLGMLDFVFSCRTCTDQRCITPCEYDSIRFDPDIREVVINETSCVGCSLCSQACTFETIEMVEIEDTRHPTYREKFKARLEEDGALAFGAGKGRVARPRRLANKCDHCYAFSDQACVSACPTGALIEVSAYELFQERSSEARIAAQKGYDRDLKPRRHEILPIDPFTKGIGVRDSGMAKTRRGRLTPVILWGVSLAAWFLALAEIILRAVKPASSLQYVMLRAEGLTPAIAELKVGFSAGKDLLVLCGYVGTVLMIISILYVPVRRIKGFRRIASNTMWFDLHLMSGTMGPAFIVLHTGLKLDNWVAAAFWSMVIVFVSGVIGRYLYTQVPDLTNGRELEELDHSRAFAQFRSQYPQAMAVADGIIAPHRLRAQQVADHAGMTGAFLWLMMEDLKRPIRRIRRRSAIGASGVSRKVAKGISERTGRQLRINRRRVLASRTQLLLHSWKKVHVPFSVIMAIISIAHIYFAFRAFGFSF